MQKIYITLFGFLILSGCTHQNEPPPLEERLLEVESESSPKAEAQDQADEVEASKIPNLELSDETQVFEKYLPTLMFHYIEDIPADSLDQMRYGLSISPDRLEEFLIYFKENDIQTLTYWDLVQIINGEMEFPEKAVMLTFDDGHNDHYTEAFRLLKQYDMRGVFLIISGKPDVDAEYATWEQVQEMSDQGQEIGAHTVSHPDLTSLSAEALRSELEESKKVLEGKIGKPVISLAYPGGDYNEAVLQVAKDLYTFARTTNPGKDFNLQQRYELPTVRIFPETGVASLRTWFADHE